MENTGKYPSKMDDDWGYSHDSGNLHLIRGISQPLTDLHFLPTVRHRGYRLPGVEQVVALWSRALLQTKGKHGKTMRITTVPMFCTCSKIIQHLKLVPKFHHFN
jgi:hypothetical protein